MESSNIETFNKCVAIILVQLYEQFPVRIDDMQFNDLAIQLFKEKDDPTVHEHNLDVFYSTVNWLEQAEYIWLSGINDLHAFNVTLSPKGLELLKMVPESLRESKRTIGQELVDVLKGGAKGSVSKVITLALTEGYKILST